MKYFVIEPEVAGGLGEKTEGDFSVYPPLVTNLHYEFQGWLGDDILESFPCFLVSYNLSQSLKKTSLTGFDLDAAKITTSELFNELYPNKTLPEFLWLKVNGKAGQDDFGITEGSLLVVSNVALSHLKQFSFENVEEFEFVG
ncbi:hypothetical protein [Vibrio sp. THAF190c]|uniref:hypothetical protein n=1 Tax=Vibrio sp. THAF190c TaxID=2587865 RepID=UPI001267B0B7|nr:hypothetical protein [Vibrio sp. THAF190c]QFT12966.1 hypothetical protein FIV04_23785 [Vibrio sp. THAF190c]|tara:strand:+ start:162 stop:587 length:426 start_codon:yes stop_codon:yes gene_type:complete